MRDKKIYPAGQPDAGPFKFHVLCRENFFFSKVGDKHLNDKYSDKSY